MAKELNNDLKQHNYKVIIFWALIAAITVLFAVLFVIRVLDTRIIDSYEDIERENLNLVVDITSEEGTYFVYIYSAKKNDEGKLVNTAKSDNDKANDVFPTILNYFNYVKRNEKKDHSDDIFYKIYGFNVNNKDDDPNLQRLDLKVSDLPVLVKVDGTNDGINDTITEVNKMRETLTNIMTKKK